MDVGEPKGYNAAPGLATKAGQGGIRHQMRRERRVSIEGAAPTCSARALAALGWAAP
jgi:hypothetical protein